jgi:hypothetical protein
MSITNVTNLRGSFDYDFREDGASITWFPGKGQRGWHQSTLVTVERAKQHMWEQQALAELLTLG